MITQKATSTISVPPSFCFARGLAVHLPTVWNVWQWIPGQILRCLRHAQNCPGITPKKWYRQKAQKKGRYFLNTLAVRVPSCDKLCSIWRSPITDRRIISPPKRKKGPHSDDAGTGGTTLLTAFAVLGPRFCDRYGKFKENDLFFSFWKLRKLPTQLTHTTWALIADSRFCTVTNHDF